MISVTLQGANWDEILQAAEAMCAGGDEPVTEGATAPAKGKRGRKKTIEVQGSASGDHLSRYRGAGTRRNQIPPKQPRALQFPRLRLLQRLRLRLHWEK